MISHIHTLFELICILYENRHQTLKINNFQNLRDIQFKRANANPCINV